jgi:hypothetical protein
MSDDKKKMSKKERIEEEKRTLEWFRMHMAEKEEGMSEEEKSRERFQTEEFIDDYSKWKVEQEGGYSSDESDEQEELLTRKEWFEYITELSKGIGILRKRLDYIGLAVAIIIVLLIAPWAMGQLWDFNFNY